MSKYSTKNQADSMKKPQFIFDSKDDEEEDDDDDIVMTGHKGTDKNIHSKHLVDFSQKNSQNSNHVSQTTNNKKSENNMERDFVNAFLDIDANSKHGSFLIVYRLHFS